MKKLFLLLTAFVGTWTMALACTNLIVGKNASTDGSTIVSYSADSYELHPSSSKKRETTS